MKVYIAAPYELKEFATAVMTTLEGRGHIVASRWLTDVEDPHDLSMQDAYASKSLADVLSADTLLALNPSGFKRSGTGGRHVELGYALALNKMIVILGVRSNVFHHLGCVRVIEKLEDL